MLSPDPRRRTRRTLAVLLAIAVLAAGCSLLRRERSDILVLVRAGDTLSRAIGEQYAAGHRIPATRILALPLPSGPRQTEIDWAGFQTTIAEPLEAYLAREDPENEIEILITTRGLPLRIGRCEGNDPRDIPRRCRAAALDAALAGLGRIEPDTPGLGDAPNPYFREPRSFSAFRRAQPEAKLRFLVARLTGPGTTPGAGAAPDATEPPPEWLTRLASPRPLIERKAGEPPPAWRIATRPGASLRSPVTRLLLSPIAERLPQAGYAIRDADDAASDPVRPDAAGAAGIVYADLEESASLRVELARRVIALAEPGLVIDLTPRFAGGSPEGWSAGFDEAVADWLAVGARALSTHLADPGLAGVTRPAVQIDALLAGRPAVEAHFASVPHLGWMNVFVGDPLAQLPEPSAGAGLRPPGDRDADGIPDADDNCIDHPNPRQRDTDGDGLGNRCDPDVDGDGLVTTSWGRIYPMDARGDLEAIALTIRAGTHDPDHDLDGDGVVDETDLARAQLWLFRAPGASGSSAGAD